MIIPDDDVLARHSSSGECLLCRRWFLVLEPHHAFQKRGMGGGSRIDVDENIAGLCRWCHLKTDDDVQAVAEIRERIARRHGTTVEAIRDWLNLILRTPKEHERPRRPWGEPEEVASG